MVTDEMVEKAARAMCEAWHYSKIGTPDGDAEWRKKQDQYRKQSRAALEAALSAAEQVTSRNDEAGYVEFLNQDVPYIVRNIQGAAAILMDLETRNVVGYRVYDPDSVFAPQPAPSVAVKALEWEIPTGANDYYADAISIIGRYRIRPKRGFGFELLLFMADTFPFYESMEEAKSAAQADYEARIRSALSAQVQDVEGMPQDVIDLVIAAREFWDMHNDMEPESNALDKALEKFSSRVPFEDANLIFPAAPAKQEA